MLGLLGAAYEMIRFRDDYPRQVIANAKAFAHALADQGLAIEGDPENDFTETHQVLLRARLGKGDHISNRLEVNNVITNPQALYDDPGFVAASGVRMGTQEMTRHGMKEVDFREFAALLAAIVSDGSVKEKDAWREQVKTFRCRFTAMHYCF